MATDYLYSAVVNQKLAFARVELAAASAQGGDTIQDRLAQHAHLDSAVAQLCSALAYFVAEVAEQYGVALNPACNEPSAVLEAFADSGTRSAELAELQSLRKTDSWLAELLAARADPLLLARRFKSRTRGEEEEAGEGLVPLVDVTEASAPTEEPLALVEAWARAAQSLVDRLRSSLHEE